MDAAARRETIRQILSQTGRPISAAALAARLGVSRQIIVGDVALLRASGTDIAATPRGYVLRHAVRGLVRTVACCHTAEGMEAELTAVVDLGCAVLDVIVEHPIYGELTGTLELRSRYDVQQFIARCQEADAAPLSLLTEGIHLHTLACPDEARYRSVLSALREQGILLEVSANGASGD